MDLYSKIAKEEGIDRSTVKSLAMPYTYGEYRESQMEDLIRHAVKMHKSFLNLERDNLVAVPDLPKGVEIQPLKSTKFKKPAATLTNLGIDEKEAKEMIKRYFEMFPTFKDIEKNHIVAAIEHHNGNKSQASRTLGITIRTLYNKLELYGLHDLYNSRPRSDTVTCPVVEEFKKRK